MFNELLFVVYSIIVAAMALISLRLGKEALVAYITLVAVLANVFVLKQISLGGYTATASDVLVIGSVLGLNLLQEYFGKSIAQATVWISFACLIFYTIVSQLHMLYIPAAHDTMHLHYAALLSPMLRITIASLTTYFIVQSLDVYIYSMLKAVLKGRFIIVRNLLSIATTQLLDTVLFGILGLYGLVDDLTSILLISYLIKLSALAITAPCVGLSKKFIAAGKIE